MADGDTRAGSGAEPLEVRARTKIVATVGPACQGRLKDLVEAGVDVFRLNTAHGSVEERDKILSDIRKVSKEVGRPLGVLCDLAGPKIRLTQLLEDPLVCHLGERFTFVRGDLKARNELGSTYSSLVDELQEGHSVKLCDGTVSMRVVSKSERGVVAEVDGAGTLRSKQGINLPGVQLSVSSLTEKDRSNLVWAAKNGVDFVSLSFVRSGQELEDLRKLLRDHGSDAWVIAKVEKAEAVERMEEVVSASDGVMVARGDLGVEVDMARVAVVQKQLVALCRTQAKPCIVATQMLDSMQRQPLPTRAEVSDVANAILDGADACMLSGESAIGDFPVEAVSMMNRIMLATEPLLQGRSARLQAGSSGVTRVTCGCVMGAAVVAEEVDAKLVVVSTHSGATARVRAKQQDFTATVVVSDQESTLRKACLLWGAVPLPGCPVEDVQKLTAFISSWGLADGSLSGGDNVVCIVGTDITQEGAHNCVLVHQVSANAHED